MLHLSSPAQTIEEIVAFLKQTYTTQQKTEAVVAVSGGIDSALSLSLVCLALGAEHVHPLLLPFETQSVTDSQAIVLWNKIPEKNCRQINIAGLVAGASSILLGVDQDHVRYGNLMARARMMVVYDVAKELEALVCGTENKSEKYLGYFTRFGDEASDIEPLQHLYKTQVRQLVAHLGLPSVFLDKPPSAGLWKNQSDEKEMGFSYEVADQVLWQLIDEGKKREEIHVPGVSPQDVAQVLAQVDSMQFKQVVPYHLP